MKTNKRNSYFTIGDTVSLRHTFEIHNSSSTLNITNINKNCIIKEFKGDYCYLLKIENKNKLYSLRTKDRIKNNIYYSRNVLVEKKIDLNLYKFKSI